MGFLALISLNAPEAIAATLARVRIGYPSPSANFYPLFATKEANLFEKYGFEPEMIYVQGVQLIAVQVAGQLDFSSVSGLVFLQASLEGSDLILLASSNDSQPMKLMVHSGITGPKDLKGKTVAVTRRLLTDKELGIRALRKYGGVNDRELLTTTYDLFTSRYTKKVPKINPRTVETALNLLAEGNPKAKGRKAEEFMDTSFMDELESTGFVKSVWP